MRQQVQLFPAQNHDGESSTCCSSVCDRAAKNMGDPGKNTKVSSPVSMWCCHNAHCSVKMMTVSTHILFHGWVVWICFRLPRNRQCGLFCFKGCTPLCFKADSYELGEHIKDIALLPNCTMYVHSELDMQLMLRHGSIYHADVNSALRFFICQIMNDSCQCGFDLEQNIKHGTQ